LSAKKSQKSTTGQTADYRNTSKTTTKCKSKSKLEPEKPINLTAASIIGPRKSALKWNGVPAEDFAPGATCHVSATTKGGGHWTWSSPDARCQESWNYGVQESGGLPVLGLDAVPRPLRHFFQVHPSPEWRWKFHREWLAEEENNWTTNGLNYGQKSQPINLTWTLPAVKSWSQIKPIIIFFRKHKKKS